MAPTAGDARFDVCGIGNALVDVLARADDAFLAAHALAKGTMSLIDEERADALYALMGPAVERSGGSAANTMVGIASLGGRSAYIGRVRDDQLGAVFRHDIRAAGVAFDSAAATSGPATGRSLIFVTPDAHRTMQTYLGAANGLTPDDVDADVVAASGIVYLEGYLWDPPAAKEAFLKAARVAHEAGRRVALTLSDPFCVERYREEFLDLARNHVDVLFANEQELLSLYRVESFDDALQRVRADAARTGAMAALTRSEKGSVVVAGDEVHVVDAEPAEVVDTTGAGDLYAAGFLHGLARGLPPAACGRIGAIAAAEAISHFGARPERPLAALVAAAGVA